MADFTPPSKSTIPYDHPVTRISFHAPCSEGSGNVLSRSEDAALLFGRLLVAALLLPGGIDKLLHFSKFAASLATKGVPYAKVLAVFDVAIEVVGPVALIIGLWPLWTALAHGAHSRDHVGDVPVWDVRRGISPATAGPSGEEPRRDRWPSVLRGERTRGLEPNRPAKGLRRA